MLVFVPRRNTIAMSMMLLLLAAVITGLVALICTEDVLASVPAPTHPPVAGVCILHGGAGASATAATAPAGAQAGGGLLAADGSASPPLVFRHRDEAAPSVVSLAVSSSAADPLFGRLLL